MSCNVYADLGYTNPDEMLAKAYIVHRITKAMQSRRLSVLAASRLTGIPAERLERILSGHFRDVEPEYLLGAARKLGHNLRVDLELLHEGQQQSGEFKLIPPLIFQ